MAEIPIQRKTGAGIWPWLLGLLLLLVLLWFFFWRNHNNATTAATTADTTVTADSTATSAPAAGVVGTGATGTVSDTANGMMTGANSGANSGATGANAAGGMNQSGMSAAVGDFARFVAVVDPNTDEAKQHAYAAGGLRRLADALASVGASGAPLDNMRKQAAALQNSNPSSTGHADMARSAFASATDAFDSLKGKYPGLDAARVRTAADALKTGPHLLNQKDRIQAFFETARDALQGMTGAAVRQ